jgi:hypothetical protein
MWYLGGLVLSLVMILTAAVAFFRVPQNHWLEPVMILLIFTSVMFSVMFGTWL